MGLWNQASRQGRMGKTFSAKVVGWLACGALAVSPLVSSPTLAQEKVQLDAVPADSVNATEPVLVLTLGSMNKLMKDVNYLSSAVGQPQAGGMFTMLAGTFTQGIDLDMPIGVLVPLVDGSASADRGAADQRRQDRAETLGSSNRSRRRIG